MNKFESKVYLKQNVLAEPLFNQWYAWSYLISPVTAAMYVANSHMKIIESFLSNPQVHISALKNPAMIGGPFMNHGANKVADIKALKDKTINGQAHLLTLAEAIKSLDDILLKEAAGYSLETLYQKIPDALKGFVELVYDLNNSPSVRFIEGLFYKSLYYDPSSQTIALSLVDKDNRSFAFSTPRLPGEGYLHLPMPFSSEGIDELFKMKQVPQTFGWICDALNIKSDDMQLFSSFFTDEAPQKRPRWDGDKLRIRYFGHACILFETDKTTVLCDPVISYELDGSISRYTYSELPDTINYVLLTHNHQDHCMFETLLQLRHKIEHIIVPSNNSGALADPSLKLILQNIGFTNVIDIDEMETITVDGGTITSLPFFGEHADLNIKSKTVYLINLGGKSVLCAADSNNLLDGIYKPVYDVVGDVDTIFVGMECDGAPLTWLYGPLLTRPIARKSDQSRRFDGSDCRKAIDLVNRFHPKEVYVYAMGQEPWLTYLTSIQYTEQSRPIVESNKLVEYCKDHDIVSERLFGCKDIL